MKIGELFKDREAAYRPSPEEIAEREVLAARRAFPNATTETEALALSASALAKNLRERTVERDDTTDAFNTLAALYQKVTGVRIPNRWVFMAEVRAGNRFDDKAAQDAADAEYSVRMKAERIYGKDTA